LLKKKTEICKNY